MDNKNKITLILDLDGVLIVTPQWKSDTIHEDGYSDFNIECVKNLNCLLNKYIVEIWLSSTRRTTNLWKSSMFFFLIEKFINQ
jgi:hypothetical protein